MSGAKVYRIQGVKDEVVYMCHAIVLFFSFI